MPAIAQQRSRVIAHVKFWGVYALVGACAILGSTAGCHPARTPVIDPLLTAALAGAVAWAGATANWWALAGAAGLLAVVDPTGWKVLVTAAACVIALVVGIRRRRDAVLRTLAASGIVQVALRLHATHPFGLSAAVALVALGAVAVAGIQRRRSIVRRRVRVTLLVLVGGALAAVVCAAVGLLSSRASLTRGVTQATAGLRSARAGHASEASDHLSAAATALGKAHRGVHSWWMLPARAVPILSQHVQTAVGLVDAGRDAAHTVAVAVAGVDPSSIKVAGGYVDLAAIEDLVDPLGAVDEAVTQLDQAVQRARSGWLVDPLASDLRRLASETGKARVQAHNASLVSQLAPDLLGKNGPRTWLVLFTTPAEARGLGGFPGDYAELTTAYGHITIGKVGSIVNLIDGGTNPDGRIMSAPADYFSRYGPFGTGSATEPMNRLFWDDVTISPDLPSVAQVVASLYPQSGGRAIDGVIVADPIALGGLLQLTGPVTVPGHDGPLTASNVAHFLLVDQYQAFADASAQRQDALTTVASTVSSALLSASLPSPVTVASALGGPARGSHLMLWSLHADEQPILNELGVSGSMPRPAPDGFSYTLNNAGPNKLDTYLERTVKYRANVDARTGRESATVTIKLHNTLPVPITLPPDVVGNRWNYPAGTDRTWLSLYSPLKLSTADVDGTPVALSSGHELGWAVYSTYLHIAPGATVTLTVRLGGSLDLTHGYGFVVRPQPLSAADKLQVSIKLSHPKRSLRYTGSPNAVLRLT
jgi:hypothetical protein